MPTRPLKSGYVRPDHPKPRHALLAAATTALIALVASHALAQDAVLARVNGKALTEADLKLAEAEIGADLGNLPPATRRRVLVEFLIENQLFADAADAAKLGQGAAFDGRMQYWRRRALRDTYFETTIKGAVSEAEAKTYYDSQVSQLKPEIEVKASHILVESQDQAKELREKIAHGADFADVAREHSKDPGSKSDGGALGYFARGQMVPQFEEAAFKLEKGDVSQPVQTQFGWHLIRLEDKRQKSAPEFAVVKDRLLGNMIHQKAQAIVTELRGKATLEYIDPEVKAQLEAEAGQKKP